MLELEDIRSTKKLKISKQHEPIKTGKKITIKSSSSEINLKVYLCKKNCVLSFIRILFPHYKFNIHSLYQKNQKDAELYFPKSKKERKCKQPWKPQEHCCLGINYSELNIWHCAYNEPTRHGDENDEEKRLRGIFREERGVKFGRTKALVFLW